MFMLLRTTTGFEELPFDLPIAILEVTPTHIQLHAYTEKNVVGDMRFTLVSGAIFPHKSLYDYLRNEIHTLAYDGFFGWAPDIRSLINLEIERGALHAEDMMDSCVGGLREDHLMTYLPDDSFYAPTLSDIVRNIRNYGGHIVATPLKQDVSENSL